MQYKEISDAVLLILDIDSKLTNYNVAFSNSILGHCKWFKVFIVAFWIKSIGHNDLKRLDKKYVNSAVILFQF